MLNTESKHASPDWVRAAVTEQDFLLEQAQLSQVWTFVGYVQDIPDNNDWMRVDLAGRSVIVQRFGTTIRAFENVCQHRFHPIHVAPRGNGPLRCGFHGWQYDQEGQAAMVPKCREMFGCTPDALQMRLNTLEVDTCGSLIFARFGSGPGLREWLAGSFDIMQYLTRAAVKDGEVSQLVDSHWKFMLEITLDDYHVVAVHPQSFGKNGHTPMSRINYYRMGEHSALIPSGRPDSIEKIVAECQAGQAVMAVYRADDFEVMLKSDQSPLTQADLAAHHCIVEGLGRLPQPYPVVSEEDAASHIGSHGDRYWLIDPLDGTREFVARSDEFTVNIALIDHGQPVLGVVFAPALDLLYCGAAGDALAGEGAVRIQDGQVTHLQLEAPAVRPSPCRVVASKNHLNQATRAFIEQLGDTVLVQAGSSLKICRVAEGEAARYHRRLH